MKDKKESIEYHNEILRRNSGIDKKLVEKQEKLENNLKKLGVDIKPKYSLEPPLGFLKLYLYNQNK